MDAQFFAHNFECSIAAYKYSMPCVPNNFESNKEQIYLRQLR